jgi:hypothetical protein
VAPPPKPTYVIDGASFSDLDGFIEECNRSFIRGFGGEWNGLSWDAFHDYFSWTEGDYVLVWKRFDRAHDALGEHLDIILDIISGEPHVELRLE